MVAPSRSPHDGDAMSRLIEHTRELIRERPRSKTFAVMSKDLDLPVSWLFAFSQNAHEDYFTKRVEKLYVYLSGQELKL